MLIKSAEQIGIENIINVKSSSLFVHQKSIKINHINIEESKIINIIVLKKTIGILFFLEFFSYIFFFKGLKDMYKKTRIHINKKQKMKAFIIGNQINFDDIYI